MSSITSRQANVMDHALAYPNLYRNHFCAVPETPNDDAWLELVEMEYASFLRTDGNRKVYRVTPQGIEALTRYHEEQETKT